MTSSGSTDYAIVLNADGATQYMISVWKLADSGGTAQPTKVGYLSAESYLSYYRAVVQPNGGSKFVFYSQSGIIQSSSSDPFMIGFLDPSNKVWYLYSGVNYIEFDDGIPSNVTPNQVLLSTTITPPGTTYAPYVWTMYYSNQPSLQTAETPVILTSGYIPGLYLASDSPLIGLPTESFLLPAVAADESYEQLTMFMIEPTDQYAYCYPNASSGSCSVTEQYQDTWFCGPLGNGSYCVAPDASDNYVIPVAPNCNVCSEATPAPPPPPPPPPGAGTVWSYLNWKVIGISIGVAAAAIIFIALFVSIARAKSVRQALEDEGE